MRKVIFIFFAVAMFSYASELHGSVKGFPKKFPVLDNLISDDGRSFDFNQFKGKVLLITYGYTSCPHVCPTMLSYLKEVETILNEKGYENMFRIVFISVDPMEDVNMLSSYKKFSGLDNFIFVTGDAESLKKTWRLLNVYVKDKGFMKADHGSSSEHRMIDHTAKLTVVDKRGYIREEFLGMYIPVDHVVEDVIALIEE
ncbi:SCO family protein [Persephonella sp.]